MNIEQLVQNGKPVMKTNSRQYNLWIGLIAVVFITTSLTVILRAYNLQTAYDIFLDEITYLFISESVAENLSVRLHGETFYLHPPVFFYLEGAYLKLFQPLGDLVQRVYAVRYLTVALAGVSSGLIFLIGRSAAGPLAGLLAAYFYALDPLGIRLGSRNMLEVAAMTWVLLGLLTIMPNHSNRLSLWRIVGAGVLFGLAILTKDMMVFLTLLPLTICFIFQRCLTRRTAFSIGAIAVLVYALYPFGVWLSGDWARFVEKKTRGIARLIGLVQETGFNRPVGPGLLNSVLEKMGEFGPTYLLFAIGGIALLFLWNQSNERGRLVAVWAASAYALLAYLIPVGTLETQFFYYILAPAALTTGIAVAILFQQTPAGSLSRRLRLAVLPILGLILLWSIGQWMQIHNPDNGYERVLTYVAEEIPPEAKVAATGETAQFLLDERASGPWGSWYTLETLATYRPDYVIVSQRQLEWDHGALALPLLNWLESHGEPVFTFEGRTNVQLLIYYLPPTSWSTLSFTFDKTVFNH